MFEIKVYRGVVLRIAVVITALVLLLLGGASASASWFINDNATGGDCTSIGIWNAASKVCSLTTDLTEGIDVNGIEIDSDYITLNGNGHLISGRSGFVSYHIGIGINLTGRKGIIIENMNVRNFSYGIYLYSSNNSTISGNNATNNDRGIELDFSSNNILSGNNADLNNDRGIYLYSSGNNTLIHNNGNLNNHYGIHLSDSSNNILKNNTMSGNPFNFELDASSDLDFDNSIDTSNLANGKPIYYIITANNTIFDSSTNAGTFYCISCVNVTLKDLNLNNNFYGIFFWNTTQSRIQNINASNNGYGIYLYSSDNNTLAGNNASNSYNGIYLYSSNNNTLSGSNADSNHQYGIYLTTSRYNTLSRTEGIMINFYGNGIFLYSSSNNTLGDNNAGLNNANGIYLYNSSNNTLSRNNALNNSIGIYLQVSSENNTLIGNNVNSNSLYGIDLMYSTDNLIYNNIFNNTNNYNNLWVDGNTWNITKTPGTNVIGGSYLGGNFWVNPESTGFGQTCSDADSDGICDSPYILDSNNTDYLPLSYKFTSTPTPTPTPPAPKFPDTLVSSITPNSRIAQLGTPVTLFMSIINYGTGTATGVSIAQASSLPATISYQQWDGAAFTGSANTPVDMPAGSTANFVITIDATSEFNSSPMTFNVSSTNGARAAINGVNTLTMSASSTPSADVIMISTTLNVSTPVNTAKAFASATTNVGGASATDVSLVVSVPAAITGLAYQVNQTNSTTGAIIGPATGLTIAVGAQPTFAVFLIPTQAIAFDPTNNRINLQLIDGSGKVIGAQSVAVSTT